MKIDWEKIVTNAVSTLVVATFMGAALVVWRGATTVDDKVKETRADVVHLINSLSDKLGGYQVQLVAISNQLVEMAVEFQKHQSNRLTRMSPAALSAPGIDVQQKAYSRDIYQQLNRPEPKK